MGWSLKGSVSGTNFANVNNNGNANYNNASNANGVRLDFTPAPNGPASTVRQGERRGHPFQDLPG